MENIDKSFLGTGWGFPPTFNRQWHGVEMVEQEEDVRSSIEIILCTLTGERVKLPTFGCNLRPQLFEAMNVPNIALVEKFVHDALVYHEPRIIVEDINSEAFQEEGRLEITIQYSIIATNTRYNYVFPFYMNEATNIERG